MRPFPTVEFTGPYGLTRIICANIADRFDEPAYVHLSPRVPRAAYCKADVDVRTARGDLLCWVSVELPEQYNVDDPPPLPPGLAEWMLALAAERFNAPIEQVFDEDV